jgi:HSP20 family molecular chaperone IbpA
MNNEVVKADKPAETVSREGTRSGHFFRPNVDIIELEDKLLLKADVPGATADSVSVDYDKGVLTLHASVGHRQPEGMLRLAQEYAVADFRREFSISEEIDSEGISADYKNGVLSVHLPKSEALKPRQIEVRAN